ncbi:MAG TPA: carbamoyl-phosphate synthase domain-containing protein, partial [Thermodesulfobacteriota bacterium]|nr:carbamoyl-phosphate synthase domain-containing protein [Thermodesulfobacteriota bacterium]
MKALLALEDGTTFRARSFTGPGEALGECVFNTAMTGYQEILTDPSYRGQLITMTYPLIGNYGVNSEDVESAAVQAEAFLMKEYLPFPSNYRSQESLGSYLKRSGVLGLEGIDTRALTRHLRNFGAMRSAASTETLDPEALTARARAIPPMAGNNLVDRVTTARPYRWHQARVHSWSPEEGKSPWKPGGSGFRVVVFDYG